MNIKYITAIPGIDWNDMQALRILSDAEEEIGNTIAASALRYLYKAGRVPDKSLTLKTEADGSIITGTCYDWARPVMRNYDIQYSPKYFLPARRSSCFIPEQILSQLPLVDDVAYDMYSAEEVGENRQWVSYWTIEDAYLAFVDTCINMNVEIIYDSVENLTYLVNHS